MNIDYFAGVMDADGHFTWREGKYMAPDIGVTNTSIELMNDLKKTWGGSIALQRSICKINCSEIHIHRRMDIYKWHLVGFRAVLLCKYLDGKMIIKNDQAKALVKKYEEALDNMERPSRRIFHMKKEQEWWDNNIIGNFGTDNAN